MWPACPLCRLASPTCPGSGDALSPPFGLRDKSPRNQPHALSVLSLVIWDPVPRCPLLLSPEQGPTGLQPATSRVTVQGDGCRPQRWVAVLFQLPYRESDHLMRCLAPASRKVAQGSPGSVDQSHPLCGPWRRHGVVEGHSFRVQPPPPTLPQIARQICHLCWTLEQVPGLPSSGWRQARGSHRGCGAHREALRRRGTAGCATNGPQGRSRL